MVDRPIIVFDSGKGGQSIYRPLKAALPGKNILYIDDHANFPYGEKSAQWLSTRFKVLGRQFLTLDPCLLVLACNTATVNVIGELRAILACPIVGVEPVIKPLAQYDAALVLMTPASAKSTRTAELLKQYGAHVQIYTPAGLAEAIECNDIAQVKIHIHEIQNFVQKEHIQAVGLSCTHYALIKEQLQQAMPSVTFIDPARAVVDQVLRVLRLGVYEQL